VGRVLDALDRLKLNEKTLIIFLSDHGYHLGEREWWNKNTLFERSCRAPLIIAAPGMKPGVARGLTEFVDVYPTVAEFCGGKPPAGVTGRSLRTQLADPTLPGKAAAFTLVTRGPKQRGDSLRTERWRYTEWSDGARELYDHQNDPEETRNLAGRAETAAVQQDLARQLAQRPR
jgi:arylsulfatase A-like enzyme